MQRKRNCGCRKNSRFPVGAVMIALGLGIFLANIIPYYLLIALLGLALITAGIWHLTGK